MSNTSNNAAPEFLQLKRNRSAAWTYTASVHSAAGKKIGFATGAGYCKESTALASALSALLPSPSASATVFAGGTEKLRGWGQLAGTGIVNVVRALQAEGYGVKVEKTGKAWGVVAVIELTRPA